MSNHFTSYTVSKALWEAGIKIFRETDTFNSFYDLKGRLFTVKQATTKDTYPAYTLGELVRELPTETNITLCHIAIQWKVLISSRLTWAETAEDALGLALIEIRKGESKTAEVQHDPQ